MSELTTRAFLEAAVPVLGLRWAGYRGVWRSVRGPARALAHAAGCASLAAYLRLLERDPAERERARAALGVTISRFHRGARTFEAVCREALAWPPGEVRAWCAGCASGEEPYTLAIFWRDVVRPRLADSRLAILATDVRDEALERARRGVYDDSSLRWIPEATRARWLERAADRWRVRDELREAVAFARHDLLADPPPSERSIVFCRNLVFTYFGDALRAEAVARLRAALRPGGLLAIGDRERWPIAEAIAEGFDPVPSDAALFRKRE
jgi:chemotaxis protein methyltransferase CheR